MGYEPAEVHAMRRAGSLAESPDGRDELLHRAKSHYAERRRRAKFLPEGLFGEPAWDLMLDLFIAAREGKEVCTSSACLAAHVPQTTALRRLHLLESQGLIERAGDPSDQRRTIIRLSAKGYSALTSFFTANAIAPKFILS